MGIKRLSQLEISNADIEWVESIMGFQFDDERRTIIKSLESVDIQAFPGSGKTTTLIAKLAILARKWPFLYSGICVLSHTNVAREEIEEQLGKTDIGKKLLKYPHFIGTFHSFFDSFVALPWLRSKNIRINMIDSDLVRNDRWYKLPSGTRFYLEKNHKDEKICSYSGDIGLIDWDKQGETRQNILNVIEKSQKDGYFTFDEMLLYAKQALDECNALCIGLQQRFPIIFIDEAQDTNPFQWALIHKAFPDGNDLTIRQGFGDSNQAIYNNINEFVEQSEFPREQPLLLSESRRFDNRIAQLANTVAISAKQMHGTSNEFSNKAIRHTLFLFSKEKAGQVINEFGQLVLDTFSDEELLHYKKDGCHVVGMVHVKKDETSPKQFPKGIYDYWPNYEAKAVNKSENPNKLIEYVRLGRTEFQKSGELSVEIETIAKGIRRLINKANGRNSIVATNNTFSSILKHLSDEGQMDLRRDFYRLTSADITTKDNWKTVQGILVNILKKFDLTANSECAKFASWVDETRINDNGQDTVLQTLPNHYLFQDLKSGRSVDLEFGSIHSVKGRTHLATLVLETYLRTHNMKAILKYLCNKPPKSMGANQSRLKCQYVAMTRARALLCLAIPIDFVNPKAQKILEEIGWNIKFVK